MRERSHDLIELAPRNSRKYVSRSRTVLATGVDGFVFSDPAEGLWCFQTRMLSRYRWWVNRRLPLVSAVSAVDPCRSLAYYIAAPVNCRETSLGECDPAQQAIELKLSRTIGNGFVEEVALTNFTQIATTVRLELEADADFADPVVASGGRRRVWGRLKRDWRERATGEWELTFDYRAKHSYRHQGDAGMAKLHRAIRLNWHLGTRKPRRLGHRIVLDVPLGPHETWRTLLRWSIAIEGNWLPLIDPAWQRERDEFAVNATSFSAEQDGMSATVLQALARAKSDLFGLRLFDADPGQGWVTAAGVPSYLAFFGRDAIATGYAAGLLTTQFALGAAEKLSATQATETNDWRDEQPGRMVHELHTNPRSVLNYTPHARYYGDITASIHFPALIASLWRWTGSRQLVEPYVKPALETLAWADQHARLAGDGFYRYQTRSSQGEKNQGWKDSQDAIVYEDGSQVSDPLGTCEMQGFVYGSKIEFARMLEEFGEHEVAERLAREAEELKTRFNQKFWMPEERYFGMGIDAKGRLIRSVSSDAAHALATGIIDRARAPAMVERLFEDDLFSGWGIRSLSATHPAFNPYAYHRGTIWPVENAMIVFGLARYGFRDEANRLSEALFEAAALFQHARLPEVFAGHARDAEHPFPGLYPRADSPQAWSASAPFQILQAILGISPDAPRESLLLAPALPAWLPNIRVNHLHVGNASADITFWREEDGQTKWRVEALRGNLRVTAAGR